jgi:hypothetical protein
MITLLFLLAYLLGSIPTAVWVSKKYYGLLNSCGGHTASFHFHQRMTCLYNETGVHSTQIGVSVDGTQYLYGKV